MLSVLNNADSTTEWVYSDVHLPGTVISYKCNKNFVLHPQGYSVTCGVGGTYIAEGLNSNGACIRGLC